MLNIRPDYFTLDKLLAKRLFRIPHYQRAYSWQRKQRNDMFEDIRKLKGNPDNFHFMATVVGLRRETKTIVTDEYNIIEIVDGQQRLTTLVLLLKAIEKQLDHSIPREKRLAQDLQELLVKPDDASLILLQTNHDLSQYFANFLRCGVSPPAKEAQTLADRELLRAIRECERFVDEWDRIELLVIIKNQLTFIFHEIDDEAAVYTVFEVLNNRGLNVSWLDRLKSILMSVAFEDKQGNSDEHINELHQIWGAIYETIGLPQGLSNNALRLSTEALRFGATLKSPTKTSKPLGEEPAVETLRKQCENVAEAIEVSNWLLKVTKAIDRFLKYTSLSREAVSRISQAKLLAVAIILQDFPPNQEKILLDEWEKTTFRIFGLCRKDARTGVGDYVRLACDILNDELNHSQISTQIKDLGEKDELSIKSALSQLKNENCYERWDGELRYLLFRYEEYLAEQQGQTFSNEHWNHIWKESAAKSIEHIVPQSKGSQERLEPDEAGIFVHRLGNLLLLPPQINSQLGNLDPEAKAEFYIDTGLLIAKEVGLTIKQSGWGIEQIEEREQKLIEWIQSEWS